MAQRRRIVEGFAKGAVDGIRRFFARAPEQQAYDLRRGGVPAVGKAGLPYSMVTQFGFDVLAAHLYIDQDLQNRYADYEEMDEYPEIGTALDIYADDSTSPDLEREQAIWAVSPDKKVADELNHLLHKVLLVEEDIWGVSRTLCKYGNVFGELLVADRGLVGINFLPAPTVRRVEDPRGNLLGFVQDINGRFNLSIDDFYKLAEARGSQPEQNRPPGVLAVFEDWEVVHWRLRGKHLRSIYGHAVTEPARWVWKRLSLLEDALLIYKLERAPSRYAFYIDVGQMDMERGLAYVNRVKNQHTRKPFINPNTGQLDMRYNPLAHDEDFYIPVRDGKRSTEIDVLQGPDYTETDSLEYHRDKLVSSLKIPKEYMGYGGQPTRNALSSEDIRFARSVMRVQRVLRAGFRKAFRVHFIASGHRNPDEVDYDVRMNVPSQILELARVEVMSATADLAQRMGEQVSTRWVLTHLYKFSEDEAAEVMKEKDQETIQRGAVEIEVEKLRNAAQPTEAVGANGLHPQDLDVRISKLLTAVEKGDWRREFEGSRRADRRVEDKIDGVLRDNGDLRRRLRGLEGLMGDIRHTLRNSPQVANPMA